MIDDRTSGPLSVPFLSAEDILSAYEDVSEHGCHRFMKVRRQGRWFMLKGLKEEFRAQLIYQELLKKEYTLMAELDHPCIIKAFAKEINEELGPCIVMEYVDGMPLDAFLATRPKAAVRRKITDQLTEALSYIHSKQILHRDLKPENILITHNGNNVKIIDFGLSDSDDYAILKQSAGTPGYIAPELLSGQPADIRSDIYSFGVILRELFPHRYRHIAARCTRMDRRKRYESVETVREALDRRDRWNRRSPLLCLSAGLVLALSLPYWEKREQPVDEIKLADNVTADQKAYLEEFAWYSNIMMQQLYDEAERKGNYRETMIAKLGKASLDIQRLGVEMGQLYGPSTPEHLQFLSTCNKWLTQFQVKISKKIEQNCPSFETASREGRLSARACDSLRWMLSPTITALPVTDITATTARGGVTLTDASFAGSSRIGLCWGPCHNPTVRGPHVELTLSGGQGRAGLDALSPNATYFVRAYIETAAGITYGNEISFTTAAGDLTAPEGAVPGLFSVREGRQVWISQGNLQYKASTDSWRFAPQPFDVIGKSNMQLSPTYSGWIDLFGWGTSGYDHGAENYQPWSGNEDTQSNRLHWAYGKQDLGLYQEDGRADWGYNRIWNGGGEEHLWRTLTLSEWVYLLFNRNTASGVRFVKGRVAGVNGLILIPDSWRDEVWPLNAVNQTESPNDANVISASDWMQYLAHAGAAFLPEAGVRTVSGIFPQLGGYYTSEAAAEGAWHLTMDNQALFFEAAGHRGDGLSVRLVRDASL